MPANPVGTQFVELTLDATKYSAAQKAILAGAQQNSADINKVFATVGTKTDEMYNAMRKNIENAYTAITKAGTFSADELRRAQESSSAKITAIDEQQFVKKTALIDTLKSNYVAASAAIVAAWVFVGKAVKMMDEAGKALQVESSFKIMAESAGVNSEKLIASMKAATRETIDDSDMMQKAIKLMLLGYDSTQIERFSNVVITASQYAGTTAAEAYDKLSDAIGNRQPKAMVRMGAVTKEQMEVVTAAITAGADSTVLFELAMANLELKQKMLKGTQDQATISLQQFHAQLEETKETIGKGIIVVMQQLYAVFQGIGGASLFASAGIYKVLQAGTALQAMATFGDVSKAYKAASEGYRAAAEADFAASDKLTKQATANFTGRVEAEAKASAQELAGGKAKVASLMTEMGAYKDTAKAQKEAEAASKKAAAEIKATNDWLTEEIRKSTAEQEGIGQNAYDAAVEQIMSEADKRRAAGGDRILIEKYVTVEASKAWKKYSNDLTIAGEKDAAEKAQWAREDYTRMIEGRNAYKKIISEESEFAATENERAINKIIWQEGQKTDAVEKLLDAGRIDFEEFEAAITLFHKNATAAILEKETENASKIAKLNYDLISGIRGWEKQAYDARIIEIDAKAAKDIADGANVANVLAKQRDDTELAYIKMGISGNNFFEGMTAGWLKQKREQETWGETGAAAVKAFSDDATKQMSTNFFNIMKGNFDQVSLDWTSLWDSMLTVLADRLAKMAVAAAVDKGVELAGKALSWLDDLVDLSDFIGLAVGEWMVKEDKVALLHAGEMVVPGAEAELIRAFLASSGGYGGLGASFDAGYNAAPSTTPNMDALNLSEFSGHMGKGAALGALSGLLAGGPAGALTGAMAGAIRGGVIAALSTAANILGLTFEGEVAASADTALSIMSSYGLGAPSEAGYGMADYGAGGGYGGAEGGYRFGGIPTGPSSGYFAQLHGTEAVVPLPNGRSIPVDLKSNRDSKEAGGSDAVFAQIAKNTAKMAKILERFDDNGMPTVRTLQ